MAAALISGEKLEMMTTVSDVKVVDTVVINISDREDVGSRHSVQ